MIKKCKRGGGNNQSETKAKHEGNNKKEMHSAEKLLALKAQKEDKLEKLHTNHNAVQKHNGQMYKHRRMQ